MSAAALAPDRWEELNQLVSLRWNTWVRSTQNRLRHKDAAAAEDIVQNAMVLATRFLPTFRGGTATLNTWVWRIVINEVYHYYRNPENRRENVELFEEALICNAEHEVIMRGMMDSINSLSIRRRDAIIDYYFFDHKETRAQRCMRWSGLRNLRKVIDKQAAPVQT